LAAPRTVTPIIDKLATGGDGAGSQRMILILAIFAISAVIGGGLFWVF
jgi:hypothetical protein